MDLSIIIPVYNEATKIAADIQLASEFLSGGDLTGEIIVVDDGSTDATNEILTKLQTLSSFKFRMLRHAENQGKGGAVRTGMLASKGTYVMFVDSGSCVPYKCAASGLELLSSGKCDLAFGSRKLPDSIITCSQSIYRRMISRMFNKFTVKFLALPATLTDTQCGFKMFKGDAAKELFSACRTNGFTFDVEIALRALKKGYRISEFPVQWSNDVDSRVHPLRMSFKVFYELVKTKKLLSAERSASVEHKYEFYK